jgi:hypothetical protein
MCRNRAAGSYGGEHLWVSSAPLPRAPAPEGVHLTDVWMNDLPTLRNPD